MKSARFRHIAAFVFSVAMLFTGNVSFAQERASMSDEVLRNIAHEHWQAWRLNRWSFPIGAWSYFQRFEGTPEEYETYRAANMTVVMVPSGQYENAVSNGLEAVLGAFEPLHEDNTLLRTTVRFPRPHDMRVTAYMLKDEPLVEDFPAIGKTVRFIYANDIRNAIPIIDFRPNWSVPYERFGMSYETYLQRFIDEVHPCVLLTCNYPLMRDGSTRAGYYDNLELFRSKALEYGIGLMGFVLVTPHTLPDNPQIDYRKPSESDLRWMVYSNLAYGAQGIWYYNWRIDDNRYGESLIDGKTGRPTVLYPVVAGINQEIQALGKVLLKLRSTGVYHTGDVIPSGTRRYMERCLAPISGWSGNDFLIGEFENQDDPRDAAAYLMIVNKRHEIGTAAADLRSTASFTVNPEYGDVFCYNSESGNFVTLNGVNRNYKLELNGGQGVLLRFDREGKQ
ncbi:hypothetical protein LLG96_14860 [bacterium]|nr:hypothetical protein [bacterium]